MIRSPLFLALALIVTAVAAADDVVPLKKYSGICRDDRLRPVAPKSGVIVDQESLVTLWKAWTVEGPVPSLNFRDHLVTVATVDGPNRSFSGALQLSEAGDLTYQVASTKMAGPGFGYLLMVVPRAGLKSVNGQAIPAGPGEAPASPAIADSIEVTVVGTVETGIMAIGGETTGSTITSSGLTWELDFQAADQVEIAKQLGTRKARVQGMLIRIPGVEVAQRTIIEVRSITPANQPSPDRETAPVPTPPRTGPLTQPRVRPEPTPPPEVDPEKLTSFESMTITIAGPLVAGEQTQTVAPNGAVSVELGDQSENWQIPPDRLVMLHDHIARTDWANVPRLTRSNESGVFNYTIEIKTRSGITRIFIDSPSVPEVPAIKMLFRLLRK